MSPSPHGLPLYCLGNPIFLSLQCCIQSLGTSFQGTQRIPDHSITPPLAHISPRGDFLYQVVHLLPTEKFILFLEKIILRGGMPLFLVEKFFPFWGKPSTLGNAHSPCLEIPSPLHEIPSSRNAPSSH